LLSFVVFLAVQNRSWKTLPAQCAGLALGLGLGAAVWAPGLFERQFVKLDRLLDGYLQYTNHFVYLQQFFATNWGYGLSVAGYDDGMSFSLGWGHLLVAAFGWIAVTRWMSRRERRGRRRLLGFFSAWCILLGVSMLAGSEWFWATLPLMKYIEFPWRMLAPACFCLAAVCAAAGPVISKWNSFRGPAMAAALALLILPNLAHIAPPGYQTVDLRQWTPQQLTLRGISVTTRNEYEPIGAHSPGYRAEPARILAGSAQGELHRLTPTYWSGEIAAGAGTTLEISCFFFPGWQARIDGRPAPIDASPDNGLIRLSFPEGRHHLELFFSRTPLRAFAELISLASAMVLAAFLWRAKRKSRAASGGEPPPAAA
jgi:hypothetical protein